MYGARAEMSRAVAIGHELRLGGYALAGVEVKHAPDAEAARAAWEALPEDVALLVLDATAHEALARPLAERPRLVWAVVPS